MRSPAHAPIAARTPPVMARKRTAMQGAYALRLLLAGLMLAMCGTTDFQLRAQEPAAPPVFKSRSDLVVLHVNVFDGRSDAVPNLPQSAFQVVEDGKPQPITFFSGADVPVAVGLVIDNSTS